MRIVPVEYVNFALRTRVEIPSLWEIYHCTIMQFRRFGIFGSVDPHAPSPRCPSLYNVASRRTRVFSGVRLRFRHVIGQRATVQSAS